MARAAKKAYSDRALSDVADQFKMLVDPTRLRILGALAKNDLRVGALADAVGMSPSAVSHHLSLLRAAKFVDTKRDGQRIIYTLTDLGRVMWATAEKLLL